MPKLNNPPKKPVKKLAKSTPPPEAIEISDDIEDIRVALHEICARLTAVSTKLLILVSNDDIPF